MENFAKKAVVCAQNKFDGTTHFVRSAGDVYLKRAANHLLVLSSKDPDIQSYNGLTDDEAVEIISKIKMGRNDYLLYGQMPSWIIRPYKRQNFSPDNGEYLKSDGTSWFKNKEDVNQFLSLK